MPKKFPPEVRERAIRMTLDQLDEYYSVSAAARAVTPKLNVGVETLRRWVLQAQIDAGVKASPSSAEPHEIRQLKRENHDLKEANEILKKASIYFARELDPHRH
ncbi:transposase [Leifsonia sp. A12D58]|uniref:transposase n=1 Tax=Leifsonia sp. A12D58 TaxID=3397674 RepID=UPI0039DF3193